MERNSSFLKKEFGKSLLPVMISMLAGTVNTLIDSAFVTRRLNAHALAAVNLCMPVFLTLCMVGCLFGVGSFTAASRALGKRNEEKAVNLYHSALLLSVLAGIFFMILGIFFSQDIAMLLCRDARLLSMVRDYCRVTLIGAVSFIIIYMPTYFIQLSGSAKDMTIMMNIMIVTDVFFDWLLLYIFDLGVRGAAAASVLSMLLSCAYGFKVLQKQDGIFRFRLDHMHFFGIKEMMMFGSTSAVGSFFDAIRMFALNWIIYRAGGALALAVWAVINSIMELSLCIKAGIPRTASPLLGIYISEHDNEGVRLLVKYEAVVGLIMSAAFSLVVIIFSRPIAIFFKLSQSLYIPFVCLGLSMMLEMLCSILGSYFNIVKRILLSNIIMISRTFIFTVGFAFIMLKAGWNIWLFLPLSMAATLAFTVIITRVISKGSHDNEHQLSGILLLDDYLEKNNKIKCFSIRATDEMICKASEDISEFCIDNNMDRKLATKLGLALEEVMTVMAGKSLRNENDPVDVRIYSYDDEMGLSIMCSGNRYNLFEEAEKNEDDFNMGVKMINKLASDCHYIYTLGMNILTVEFRYGVQLFN